MSPEAVEEDQVSIICKIASRNPDSSRRVEVFFAPGNRFDVRFTDVAPEPLEHPSDVRIVEGHDEDPRTPLHRLLSSTTEQGLFNQVLEMIKQVVPDLKDVRILTEADSPIVQFVYEDCSVPSALAGDGVYSLLRLSLELASHPQGTVLLEEPEVHQHPGAIRQTMRAILAAVSRDIQVVLTTHSLELIDSFLAESSEEDLEKLSLYRLSLQDGALTSRRMPGSEVAFSRGEIEKDLR